MSSANETNAAAALGLWDTVSIVIGIVVGVSIFKAPPTVFSNMPAPWSVLAVWVLGGGLSLLGALCYAELATTYPRSGGGYVYLSRAYGSWMGFLFGWAQLVAILTGSIGAMAYVFGDYGAAVFGLPSHTAIWFALAAVIALTIMNLFGVVVGKAAQNALTIAKIIGLGVIVLAGVAWGRAPTEWTVARSVEGPGFGLAMIMVLYAYGGWNDAARVAAEIRNPRRNIPLALLLGTCGITLVYLLVNVSYLRALGFDGARRSAAPAADAMQAVMGDSGALVVSLLVMVSALGAIHGMIFTGSRVYATMGQDHRAVAWLGHWQPRMARAVNALVSQCVVTVIMIVAVGTIVGRSTIDGLFNWIGFDGLPWETFEGGFGTLVAATAPLFWLFFLLTGVALFVLRIKDRGIERPFTVPLFPVIPIVFCLTCVFMLDASIRYAGKLTLLGIIPVLLGLVPYLVYYRRSDVRP